MEKHIAKVTKEIKRYNKKYKENHFIKFILVISQTQVKIESVYFNYFPATLVIRKQCIFAEKGSLRGFYGLRLATIRESKLNVLKAQEQPKNETIGYIVSCTHA